MQLNDNVKVRRIDGQLNNILDPSNRPPLRAQESTYKYLYDLDQSIRDKYLKRTENKNPKS